MPFNRQIKFSHRVLLILCGIIDHVECNGHPFQKVLMFNTHGVKDCTD